MHKYITLPIFSHQFFPPKKMVALYLINFKIQKENLQKQEKLFYCIIVFTALVPKPLISPSSGQKCSCKKCASCFVLFQF